MASPPPTNGLTPTIAFAKMQGMTTPKKDQTCSRCGQRDSRPGRSTLCEQCYGTCRICGAPTLPIGGPGRGRYSYQPLCSPCKQEEAFKRPCAKCGGVKDKRDSSYCIKCRREYGREYARQNKSKQLKQQKKWRDKQTPETRRSAYRKKDLAKKGITLGDYDLLFAAQDGVCAICERTAAEAGGRGEHLHVDHDHDTNAVRALLCHPCNIGLGSFYDNPERLRVAADYLEKHSD